MPKSVYTDASMAVADVLGKARRGAGLLQDDLARRLGKDQSFISNIERGQRRVDVLEFYALARAMKLDPVILYRELVDNLPDNLTV